MARQSAPHHRIASYKRDSAAVRAYANSHPDTRCMSCRLTLAEIRSKRPKVTWTAGHIRDGEIGGPLAPECSHCNFSRGASAGNQKRQPKPNPSRTW